MTAKLTKIKFAPAPEMMPIWSDDFDMDLERIFPGIENEPDVEAIKKIALWVFASTGDQNGVKVMSHPSSWNGVGVPYFSEPPDLERDRSGFVRIFGSLVTRAELCCISGWDAIRDTWAHHLTISLNQTTWTWAPDYNGIFYPIMSHTRGWSEVPDIEDHKKTARQWAIRSCKRLVKLINQLPK